MKQITFISSCVVLSFLALTACSTGAEAGAAANGTKVVDDVPVGEPILLWHGGAPGSEGHDTPEVVTMRSDPATAYSPPRTVPIITNVNHPAIFPFFPPAGTTNGAAVVIAPGGGSSHISVKHEGYDLAQILVKHGITCFVLRYRLSREPNSPYSLETHSLMDDQRAIRYVRAHAAEWHVDPHRVGVMGFSAGGQISLLAATTFDKPVAGSHDAIDTENRRPDFAALIYPAGLTTPGIMNVTKDVPPMFLADARDDPVSRNLTLLYNNLAVAGVPAELHIYNGGNEGFGVRETTLPVGTWPARFVDWMGAMGLLKQ